MSPVLVLASAAFTNPAGETIRVTHPYLRDRSLRYVFPGTSCLATVIRSLRDKDLPNLLLDEIKTSSTLSVLHQ